MQYKFKPEDEPRSAQEERIRKEIERTNARLRHFRGIAASVMNDALKIWQEVWDACQDPRTCDEILEGISDPTDRIPSCGWPEFREKLHLLGHYLDYTKRLCEGSVVNTLKDESED